MFWESVLAALGVLTYWETYVVILVYVCIANIPTLVSQSLKNIYLLILQPLADAIAMVAFCLILSPIIFGIAEDPFWSLPWIMSTKAPHGMLLHISILTSISAGLFLIPIIRDFAAVRQLIVGGIALFEIQPVYYTEVEMLHMESFIPDFWFCVGLLTVSIVLLMISSVLFAALTPDTKIPAMLALLGQVLGPSFGLIPVLIYGAWLSMQTNGGFMLIHSNTEELYFQCLAIFIVPYTGNI